MKPLPDVRLARRLGAILYDWIVLFAGLVLWTLPWTLSGVTPGHRAYIFYAISVFALIFAYFAWFWVHSGSTVGMAVWKIRLVGDGRPLRWRTAVSRFAFALVSGACLGAGFLWALVPPRRRAWHDMLSDSRLADTRDQAPSAAAAEPPRAE